MDSSTERLAYLEGRAEEQGRMVDVIRDGMANLAARMDGLDARMIALEGRIDQRFVSIDGRLDRMATLLWSVLAAVVSGVISILAVLLQR